MCEILRVDMVIAYGSRHNEAHFAAVQQRFVAACTRAYHKRVGFAHIACRYVFARQVNRFETEAFGHTA